MYVEQLASDRRVAVVGDSSLALAGTLMELGARAVFVWDPDTDRAHREAERAPRGVVVRPLRGGDVGGQPSAPFDLAIVPDLGLFADPEALLARVKNFVGDEGVALVGAANRDADDSGEGFDYYDLFDLVATQFSDVTMIASLPFQGVALAELGADEDEPPPVTVDMQLAAADKVPDGFVALASERGARLDPYAIVELEPIREAREEPVEGTAEDAEASAEMIESLRARLQEAEEATQRAAALTGEAQEATHRAAALGEEVERLRLLAATAAVELQDLALRTEQAERAAAAAEPELARLSEVHAAELTRFEDTLRAQARATRELEAELTRRERMVQELVDSLDEAAEAAVAPASSTSIAEPPAAGDNFDAAAVFDENMQLRQKLDVLALELARREGEAKASAWSVAELERRLDMAAKESPSPPAGASNGGERRGEDEADPALEKRLASALDELEVLRQALTQEHEARLRAESSTEAGKEGKERQAAAHEEGLGR